MNIQKIGSLLTKLCLSTTLFTIGLFQINKCFAQYQILRFGISDIASSSFFSRYNDTLKPDQALPAGYHLNSENEHYILDMQTDGNLVLYKYDLKKINRQAIWSSRTNGKTVYWAVIQHDGNFVLYSKFSVDSDDAVKAFYAKQGVRPYQLILQNDGNIVIYDATRENVWSIGIQDRAAPPENTNQGETWGACPSSASANKSIRRFLRSEIKTTPTYPVGVSKLLCGNFNYGFRHIEFEHRNEWDLVEAIVAPFGQRNWRNTADVGIRSALYDPHQISYGRKNGKVDRTKICLSRNIYRKDRRGNTESTIVTVIIRMSDGAIVTAYPLSKYQCSANNDSED